VDTLRNTHTSRSGRASRASDGDQQADRADSRGVARVQRALDATVWPHLAGCRRTGRDTVDAIRRAGFGVEQLSLFRFPEARTPISFYILGTAGRLPGAG
jgi:hypothetical protein